MIGLGCDVNCNCINGLVDDITAAGLGEAPARKLVIAPATTTNSMMTPGRRGKHTDESEKCSEILSVWYYNTIAIHSLV